MTFHSVKRHQQGFSLPEIMVGMVIGLLGIIIIMQVTSMFEGQKRTTASGDDAQNGGAIALFTAQRDITQAGYGIISTNLVGKTLVTPFLTLNTLTPVVINPAQLNAVKDAETDAFIVIYGNSNTTPEGALITNSLPAPYSVIGGAAASDVAGTGGHSFLNGDWVTPDDGAGNGGAPNTHYLYVASGVDGLTVPATIPASSSQTYISPLATLQDTPNGPHPVLYTLGSSPAILAYAVRNGSLSLCNYLTQDCASNASTWTQLTGGIVNMRVQCVGLTALRVAVVARNSQIAPTQVSTSVPTWNPNGISAPVATAPTTSWGANWDHYRYKTFETIVPIRNAIWTGVHGC